MNITKNIIKYIDSFIYDYKNEKIIILPSSNNNAEKYYNHFKKLLSKCYGKDNNSKWYLDIALECLRCLDKNELEIFVKEPILDNYYYGFGMHMRNQYIHSSKLHEIDDADYISDQVLRVIFTLTHPYYDLRNDCWDYLFNNHYYSILQELYYEKCFNVFDNIMKSFIGKDKYELGAEPINLLKDALKIAVGEFGFLDIVISKFSKFNLEEFKVIKDDLLYEIRHDAILFPVEYNQFYSLINLGLYEMMIEYKYSYSTIRSLENWIHANLGLNDDSVKLMAKCFASINPNMTEKVCVDNSYDDIDIDQLTDDFVDEPGFISFSGFDSYDYILLNKVEPIFKTKNVYSIYKNLIIDRLQENYDYIVVDDELSCIKDSLQDISRTIVFKSDMDNFLNLFSLKREQIDFIYDFIKSECDFILFDLDQYLFKFINSEYSYSDLIYFDDHHDFIFQEDLDELYSLECFDNNDVIKDYLYEHNIGIYSKRLIYSIIISKMLIKELKIFSEDDLEQLAFEWNLQGKDYEFFKSQLCYGTYEFTLESIQLMKGNIIYTLLRLIKTKKVEHQKLYNLIQFMNNGYGDKFSIAELSLGILAKYILKSGASSHKGLEVVLLNSFDYLLQIIQKLDAEVLKNEYDYAYDKYLLDFLNNQ